MQAVLLAAGKSTRTQPLTYNKPKPLLKVMNKTLLEHNLEQLSLVREVDEVIIIIGYEKDQIIDVIANKYKNKYGKLKLRYVEQKDQQGTGHALIQVKDLLKDKFIVMNGDDLFSAKDIEKCIKHKYCVLACKVKEPSRFGVLIIGNGKLVDFIEKPKEFVGDLANTGLYVFDKKIFDKKLIKSERGEYEIIDYVKSLISTDNLFVEKVTDYWFSIGYAWHLLEANEYFVNNVKRSDVKGEKENNVVIHGNVIIGKGTKILSGTYIEGNVVIGDHCKIGPNCYLRNGTTIGDNCHIGQAVEIKNTIIGDGSKVPHLSYVGDSVIGDEVNLGAGTITANLRHDDANIKSVVREELVDSGRRKLGVIIGDNVHTGINTTLYPGRKLWPGTSTIPGEIVREDKK
jgi:UDP-N-acetylglucosamine diphosphorylase / glucose-1-phosphate thymidylyltransferase / UDP-N-acetylgalactosamine diphosphorylase / glucosamine-1-phosphate N-acetyltransferase / galactosamine-1-phosphate N-acetyltransferase